jgi:hypothetical protein
VSMLLLLSTMSSTSIYLWVLLWCCCWCMDDLMILIACYVYVQVG